MKKSLRNLMIGAVITAGIFATSSAALAATQFVQTDMNFRSGASSSATLIGSVPAGAQVEVLDLVSGWNLIRYNGMTGYIHDGNLADTYVARPSASSVRSYYDNNFTQTAHKIADSGQAKRTVYVTDGYLA
ncbi:MAG: SH3 domain-containing protein, partial [Lachnospiraceae bacterium]|nr:SH3 domain-containing protein [Lachnospiraceae bacterium]